jgi:4-diphosphocytidyl-2-C-methyl-D-erythritol kinase
MSVRGRGRSVVLRPSAKVNLTLRVGPRRPDGFHDVRTVLQSIDLHDTIRFTLRPGPFALKSRSKEMPLDRTNLIWRAADRLWRAVGRPGELRDVQVTVEKRIPAAAGLGGGSADAAATLVGLNTLWKGGAGQPELMRLAAELGSDIPFFLFGGTAVGVGRGEELYPLADIAVRHLVIMKPPFGVATADAYRWFDADRPEGSRGETSSGAVDIGWPSGPIDLVNDLAGPVSGRHPEIDASIEALIGEGAVAAAMSGSGSAVFGLFPASTVKRAARRLRRPGWLVLPVRTLSRREAGRGLGLC